jgi:receptor protein-tyrosine kinase
MSLIEQAAKRLEELRRAGVASREAFEAGHSRFGADAASRPAEQDFEPTQPLAPPPVPRRVVSPVQPPVAPQITRNLTVDLSRLASMGYLVPSNAQSLLADLLRVIKRPLLQNMTRAPEAGGPARRSNVIVVTSAVPGEGKTFVATNLAMSIAMEVDHAVLLIDGDVLRPSVFSRLGLEPQQGLMDLLVNPQTKAKDVLFNTNVPKLGLMAAGTAHDRAEELLASASMDQFLDELSARFHDRVIVIDSPPLLVTTESRALAERAGQVVLVVEADRTPREQVTRAFETLANCPIVLSVLNKSRAIESDYVYGY